MAKCKGFVAAFGPYVDYWICMLSKLDMLLLMTPPELVEGFWPCHDWKILEDKVLCPRCLSSILHEDVTLEDEELELYCGPANEAPETLFNPWNDIRPSSWVLLRPKGLVICHVWKRRAASAIYKEQGDVNLRKFLLQF